MERHRDTRSSDMATDRCMALDMNGARCRRSAIVWDSYHGDGEIYDSNRGDPGWVRVKLCRQHGRLALERRKRKVTHGD